MTTPLLNSNSNRNNTNQHNLLTKKDNNEITTINNKNSIQKIVTENDSNKNNGLYNSNQNIIYSSGESLGGVKQNAENDIMLENSDIIVQSKQKSRNLSVTSKNRSSKKGDIVEKWVSINP